MPRFPTHPLPHSCSSIGDPLPCDPHMEAEAKKLTNCGLMSDPLGEPTDA